MRRKIPLLTPLLLLLLCLVAPPAAAFTIGGDSGAPVTTGPIKAAFDQACPEGRGATLLILPKAVESNDFGNVVLLSIPADLAARGVERVLVQEETRGKTAGFIRRVSIVTRDGAVVAADDDAAFYRCRVSEPEAGTISFQCYAKTTGPRMDGAGPVRVAVRAVPPGTEAETALAKANGQPLLLSQTARPDTR